MVHPGNTSKVYSHISPSIPVIGSGTRKQVLKINEWMSCLQYSNTIIPSIIPHCICFYSVSETFAGLLCGSSCSCTSSLGSSLVGKVLVWAVIMLWVVWFIFCVPWKHELVKSKASGLPSGATEKHMPNHWKTVCSNSDNAKAIHGLVSKR